MSEGEVAPAGMRPYGPPPLSILGGGATAWGGPVGAPPSSGHNIYSYSTAAAGGMPAAGCE
jgi:hypothetical protein